MHALFTKFRHTYIHKYLTVNFGLVGIICIYFTFYFLEEFKLARFFFLRIEILKNKLINTFIYCFQIKNLVIFFQRKFEM